MARSCTRAASCPTTVTVSLIVLMVLEDRRGHVTAVFPAAVSPACPETIVSHPGLTYGGLIHDGSVRGASMIAALRDIADHYRRLGYSRLRYKAVPTIYHSAPADDDLYALFRLEGRRYRSDLSAAIDLSHRGRVTQGEPAHAGRRRRRAYQRTKAGTRSAASGKSSRPTSPGGMTRRRCTPLGRYSCCTTCSPTRSS